jgi:predicted Rossmann-fold nucleotide-binding protein
MGGEFWQPLLDLFRERLIRDGTIDPADVERFLVTDSPEEAIAAITTTAMERFRLTYGPKLKKRWWWD